jgi:hypothetical protein
MLFNRKIAELVVHMPFVSYFSDNTEWSLNSYINGYTNYRYRGSSCIHTICQKGGRNAWIELKNRIITDTKYMNIQKEKNGKYFLIGTSKDLTEEAHKLHLKNKK